MSTRVERGEVREREQEAPAQALAVSLDARLRIGRGNAYLVPAELEDLLRAIRDHGSIVKGFETLRISHQSAVALLKRWEAITGHKLVFQLRGQGSGLTAFGARLVDARDWLDARLREQFDQVARELEHFLAVDECPAQQRVRVHASHDLALEQLCVLAGARVATQLQSAGSLASLDALRRGECDIAGFHLPEPAHLLGAHLDEFARRLHPREHLVVRLYGRQQGFMLRNDLRHRVKGVRDVARLGLRVVNRERGSGTRLLFDALLAREMIDVAGIRGYEREVLSHTECAKAIRADLADAAFGIEAAARAQGLRFVPVATESYFLACRRSDEVSVALDTLATCVRGDAFQRAAGRIGGYDLRGSGRSVRVADVLAGGARAG
jgi:putative molybdopterin biosynthesis protein